MVPLPLTVPLKFQTCRNMGDVEHSKEFTRVHERVRMLVDASRSLIQVMLVKQLILIRFTIMLVRKDSQLFYFVKQKS